MRIAERLVKQKQHCSISKEVQVAVTIAVNGSISFITLTIRLIFQLCVNRGF